VFKEAAIFELAILLLEMIKGLLKVMVLDHGYQWNLFRILGPLCVLVECADFGGILGCLTVLLLLDALFELEI